MLSKDLKKIKAPLGWAILGHLRKSYDAHVMRDPFDNLIKGIRYHVTASNSDDELSSKKYQFSVEAWCYQARGSIQHQTILSFSLRERLFRDSQLENYVSNIRVFNRPYENEEEVCLNVLKFAADVIANVDSEAYFDWLSRMQHLGLLQKDFGDHLAVCENADLLARIREEMHNEGAF